MRAYFTAKKTCHEWWMIGKDGERDLGTPCFQRGWRIRGAFHKFPDLFLYRYLKWSKTLEIQYVIAIHPMRWLTNFYDFRFKWTVTAATEIHPTKAWLSQLVNFKMQSGREDTLEEWYAIKFCFKLGKNAIETYGMLQPAFGASCMNRASVFEWQKRFKEDCGGWWEVWEE